MIVMPAQAGIQERYRDLAWIPVFTGMTPRSSVMFMFLNAR
jgi:hypothetical protein